MKKGIFIVYEDVEKNISGINRKILSQVEVFENSGISMSKLQMLPKYVKGFKVLYRLPFANLAPRWKWGDSISDCDIIYLRRPFFMSGPFVRFLKEIKKRSNTKIIMEIPTYPYDAEITKDKKNYPLYIKEKIARRKLVGLIDRIATLTNDDTIFGIETLKIKNGYDFGLMKLRNIPESKQSIDLCFVALFEFWHGYDRLLDGLKEYYDNGGNRLIRFHFVGDGPECRKYKELVKKYSLQDHVIFYGLRNKEEIEEIYNLCDLGISSFGAYRIGLNCLCTLKSREYLAAGLPIVTGVKMDIMEYEELMPYILEFPNDDSVVDINKIIDFYNSLYGHDHEKNIEMAEQIRGIAKKNLSMQEAMKSVICYVTEKN